MGTRIAFPIIASSLPDGGPPVFFWVLRMRSSTHAHMPDRYGHIYSKNLRLVLRMRKPHLVYVVFLKNRKVHNYLRNNDLVLCKN